MTRVYQYGLLEPIENADIVDKQMWLGHRYKNTLTEIERERRTKVRAVLVSHGDIEPLAAEAAALVTQLETARTAIKATRASSRSRSEKAETRDAVRDLAKRLRELRAQIKAAKTLIKTDPAIAAGLLDAEEHARARQRAARAASGLYWGTYLLAEQASDMACKSKMDPTFQRWTGQGRVGVQIQGGIEVQELFVDVGTLIQIAPVDPAAYLPETRRCVRQRLIRTSLRLRVGSDERRCPVWAEWPMFMQREIPSGARIKTVVVRRRRRDCRRWEWSVSITVDDSACAPRPAPETGACALNLGWCQRSDGSLRAGYIVGDDGHEQEIVVPASILDRLRKAESIRSIRDQNLDVMRPALATWLGVNAALYAAPPLPEEAPVDEGAPAEPVDEVVAAKRDFAKRIEFLALWKSAGRFAALARWWRQHRFEGDADGYALLEAWRYRDEHLERYEAGLGRAILHRREIYRIASAQLGRRYRTLVVDDLNLRDTQRSPRVEDEDADVRAVKWQQRVVAPSSLRGALINAFGGARTTSLPVGDITRTCNACGVVDLAWKRGPSGPREHTCTSCGATWDQDANACRNLLLLRERSDADGSTEAARAAKAAAAKPSRSDRLRAAQLARSAARTARGDKPKVEQ